MLFVEIGKYFSFLFKSQTAIYGVYYGEKLKGQMDSQILVHLYQISYPRSFVKGTKGRREVCIWEASFWENA